MAASYFFREFQENQQQTLDRTVQAYRAYLDAVQAGRPLKGGMHWKKIKGREYLYKYRDRLGHGSSLGPRSPATERLWDEFGRQRRELAARLLTRRRALAEAARFCRAALIQRVPHPVIRILQRLELGDLEGAPVRVIGGHALHAFEFAAGVFLEAPPTSPCCSASPQRLTLLAAAEIEPTRLLALLRRADRSFQALPGDGLTAVNSQGFQVRCRRPPMGRAPQAKTIKAAPGVMVPPEAGDLAALASAPKFSHIVIGRRGDPVTMVAPDPRALALHLLWLSQQGDRQPGQQARDRCRAAALAELILRYLPQYDFFATELQLFPAEVTRLAENLAAGFEVAGEMETD
jgi:hypothetical protein